MKIIVVLVWMSALCSADLDHDEDDERLLFQGGDPHLHHGREMDDTLSDKDHEIDGEHNADFDHDAFLGRDQAQEFEQLSPKESKRRLGLIVDKIDKRGNSDGVVSKDELVEWMKYIKHRYADKVARTDWKKFKLTGDKLTWEAYVKEEYEKLLEQQKKNPKSDEADSTKEAMESDTRKWKAADRNGDNMLDIEEYTQFLHPEHKDYMRNHILEETFLQVDKNKDGFIDIDEFVADAYTPSQKGEKEPDWVQEEREHFKKDKDKNNDQKLDRDEVREWIFPGGDNNEIEEANHLIKEADDNKDGVLSKEEILKHSDDFVGGQTTEYGEVLNNHDEF